MRALGLDVGDRRIGVAVSDGLGITAQGLMTLTRVNLDQDLEAIVKIANEHAAETLVVGMPRNMNGSYGPRAEGVKEFVSQLQAKKAFEVVYIDERLTTVAAQRMLLEGDISRRKRKQVVDKIAAVFILQGYLDRAARD